MYREIFFTNVLKALEQKGLNKSDLHQISGVSNSFISDITQGNGNPSLATMESIALALNLPLPLLLHSNDLDEKTYNALVGQKIDLPDGYDFVCALLPEHKAYIVKRWLMENQKNI